MRKIQNAIRIIDRVGVNADNPDGGAWLSVQEILYDAGFSNEVIMEAKAYYFDVALAMRKEGVKHLGVKAESNSKAYTRGYVRECYR